MPNPPDGGPLRMIDRSKYGSANEFTAAAVSLLQSDPPFQFAFQVGSEIYFVKKD